MTQNNNSYDIISGNLKEKNIVQKSEPLLLMKSVPFSLGELKVLDTYISRIDSHKPEMCSVSFSKEEYEQLMGLTQTRVDTLRKYSKSLLQKVIEVRMPDGIRQFSLFTCADYKKDLNEKWHVTLTCSEQAKELFFDIESLKYLRYELKNILSLSSKYSYLLFLYLKRERYRKTWEVPLPELREKWLDCNDSDTYKQFKYFKRDILDKAISEINNKTDISFTYEPVKIGKRVNSIRFIAQKKAIS